MSNSQEKRVRAVRGVTLFAALALAGYAFSDHPRFGGGPGFGMTQRAMLALAVGLACCARLSLERNKQVLLLFGTALFMLLIAEVGGEMLLGPRYRPAVDHDPEYIFKLRPSRYSEHTRYEVNGGQRVLSAINADGYRGEELRKREGQKRIVVYGDSFIHSAYCELRDTFPEQLERELVSRLHADVEIINAGVASYGPDQILLRMQRELPGLRPDLIIVSIYAGNDYGDLLRNKLFRLASDGTLRRNRYVLAEEVRDGFDLNRRESILVRALRTEYRKLGRRHSPFTQVASAADPNVALMDLWLQQAKDEYQEFVVRKNDVVSNVYQDQYSADVSLLPGSESARYRVQFMDAVLGRIAALARREAIPLTLLIIPSPIDVAPSYDIGRVDRERFPDYKPGNLTSRIQEIALRRRLPFVNLFDVYRQKDANALYFHGGDDHWNEAGQKLASRTTGDYIVQSGLLGRTAAIRAAR